MNARHCQSDYINYLYPIIFNDNNYYRFMFVNTYGKSYMVSSLLLNEIFHKENFIISNN